MPADWGILAASTATRAVEKLAGTTDQDRVEPILKTSGLDHELTGAYRAAFQGFVDVLGAFVPQDDTLDARLREMFAAEAVQDALAELPRSRFEDVDTTRVQDFFLGLGLPGAGEDDFAFFWRALGRRFREQIAGTTHAAKLVELRREDRIESYLLGLADAAAPRRNESAALTAYRQYVGDLYRLADTHGLFWREKETMGEEIRLDEIFVETLLLRQDHRPLPDSESSTEGAPEDTDHERPYLDHRVREDPRRIADILARERRLVILGPPGSGKSTLVRCLALALAQRDSVSPPRGGTVLQTGLPDATIPILLTLKTYAASFKNDSSLRLDAFLREHLERRHLDLEDVLTGGNALVLLDGLDEVFDDEHRRWVSDEVWRLMNRYSKARFVLTSRPHGYRAAPLPGSVPLFEMVAFDDERIRQFFRGWFLALDRQGYEREAGRTPEQRADELAENVLERPRIRALAENPMLSTLIVMVHRSRSGRLPERRVDFYEAAVAVLTEHWEKYKRSPEQKAALSYPEPKIMKGVMAEVAWRAQTELGGREIPADVIKEWMRDALADDPEWSAERGRVPLGGSKGGKDRAVRHLLQVIQERTGLLADAGGDRYQFVHLSLQEYLVAFYLLDRMSDGQCARILRHFVHAPEWEEILRLTIGAAPRNRADALVRAVLDEPTSAWEETSRRDLRFVCRCLQDRPNVSEAVRGEVRSRWLKVLEERSYDDEGALILDGVGLGLVSATRAAVHARLADKNWSVRQTAVEYFAKIGAADETTRAAFKARLQDADWSVRQTATLYFTKIGAADETTRTAIAALLLNDNPVVQRAAASYFTRISADDEATRAIFQGRLGDDDWNVRQTAVEYFARIGAADETTRTAMAARLVDDHPTVRQAAVSYFAKIGADDETTRANIVARLADDDAFVRPIAALYFAKIGANDEATRAAFEARLGDADWSMRQVAIEYFAQIGADDETTRAAVHARLADEPNVRHAAVSYFARVGADDETTRVAVHAHLADDHWSVRQVAALYFATIGADDETTRAAVEARLADDNSTVRITAAEYFAKTALPNRFAFILDALSSVSSRVYVSPETARKLTVVLGRGAALDEDLLKRITEEEIPHFQRSLAFSVAAECRDEIRRLRTPLAEVIAGTVASEPALTEPAASANVPFNITRLEVKALRVFDDLAFDLEVAPPGSVPSGGSRGGKDSVSPPCSPQGDTGQWTLLLGDNAVGKTTLLRAVALASIEQQTASALLELTGTAAPFVRHEADRASVVLWTSIGGIRYSIVSNTASERLERQGPVVPVPVFAYGCQRGTALGGPDRSVELRSIDAVGTLFDDNAHLIHAETWLQERRLAVHEGGESWAAFYDAIRQTLIAVLPGVESLDFDENARLWLHGSKIGKAPLAAMSDAYVTTVGWIVDLIARWADISHRRGVELTGDFRERMTGLVLIDEIDLHLHPLWQTEIVTSLREQFPKMSFIATTHNPLTLMGAKAGEVHVLRQDAETGRVTVRQEDIVAGMSADDVLTGEWFGLVSTLDMDTQELLDRHRLMLRDGVAVDDPERRRLEKTLRRRLGTFPSTSLDRMVESIAAELMESDFRRKTPEERALIRQRILERARQEKARAAS